MNYVVKHIGLSKYTRPGLKLNGVKKLVVHYTANAGAGAENHYRYFENLTGRYASAHIFVDKTQAIEIIPLDEVAYHANDGTKRNVAELRPNANFLSIGVELCMERDGSFHPDTLKQAAEVFAMLCKKFNLKETDIVRHYDVTAKNCPAPWVSRPNDFEAFKLDVGNLLRPPVVASATPDKSYVIKAGDTFYSIAKEVGINVNDLIKFNPRVDPKALKVGDVIYLYAVTVAEVKPIVKPAPKPVVQPDPYAGKRVEALMNVRFYNKPSWDDRDVVGTLTKGLGFTIISRLKVGSAYQFKVKNSKGSVYYLTANVRYVKII